MFRSLPLERIYRDSRCGSVMARTAEVCLERIGRCSGGARSPTMDLADLIDRNAAFAPDRPAVRFQGLQWSYGFCPTASPRWRAR